MPYSCLRAQMMAGACSHLPHTCTYLSTSVVYVLIPACPPIQLPLYMFMPVLTSLHAPTSPYLAPPVHSCPLPGPGLPGPHSHDAAQCPDVRLAGVPISGDDLRGQEVWGPTEHSGRGNGGAQEGWGPYAKPGSPVFTQRDCSEPPSHLWQRPPGPTLVASPRSPIFTSMFLFKKKLPARWGERHR